jgi:hypothetical protein
MWKHALLLEDQSDKAPLVVSLLTGRAWQTGGYVSIIWGAASFPASGIGSSADTALADAVSIIKAARRYRVVQGPKQVGRSYIRAIRWDEGPLLTHFQAGAPLSRALLAKLNGASPDDARTHVAAEAGSPLYETWGTDETIRWERLPADIARISGTADNDLDLGDDEFWRP